MSDDATASGPGALGAAGASGLPSLPAAAIDVHVRVASWQEAVRVVGSGLVRGGFARPAYADEMVRMIEEHGPYVVIAPGLVLAHARPGPSVLGTGLALTTLSDAVPFGHPHNDPVRVVIGLATATPGEHVAAVAAVANAFDEPGAVERFAAASSVDEVLALVAG